MSETLSALPPGITDKDQCTLDICPIELATIPYVPSLPANLIFLGIFAATLLGNLALGIRFKTWGYMAAMISGCVLEVLGYVGRVQLNDKPFSHDAFLMYLICATIAPVFITAGIYLCLSRVIIVFGEPLSYLRPRTYTILFVTCDFISLLLQAGGGAIVSIADDKKGSDAGLGVMQAGLIFQVVSLVVFVALCAWFFVRVKKCQRDGDVGGRMNAGFADLRAMRRFKGFLWAFSIATLAMITRCGYRVAELIEGFDGPIWANEKEFIVLEGVVLSICVILLTVAHPGLCFAGRFHEANFAMRNAKRTKGELDSYDSSVTAADA